MSCEDSLPCVKRIPNVEASASGSLLRTLDFCIESWSCLDLQTVIDLQDWRYEIVVIKLSLVSSSVWSFSVNQVFHFIHNNSNDDKNGGICISDFFEEVFHYLLLVLVLFCIWSKLQHYISNTDSTAVPNECVPDRSFPYLHCTIRRIYCRSSSGYFTAVYQRQQQ